MLTKYYLHIDGSDFELSDDDLSNWDGIQCSYKRASYDGVVRSFTSQFEFVNRAKDLLTEIYLRDGVNAAASVSVHVINDKWEYDKVFECPLDFTTASWEDYAFKISSVDNSLAALIKAGKSTKYELAVGTDIATEGNMLFDRLPLMETLTYEFTQGEQYDDCADINVTVNKGELPYIGNVGSELTINRVLDWNDDQTTDANSFIFKAVADVTLTLDFELAWRTDSFSGDGISVNVKVRRNGSYITGSVTGGSNQLALMSPSQYSAFVGVFNDPSGLHSSVPSPTSSQWALISGSVWYGENGSWHWSGKKREDFFHMAASGKRTIALSVGDEVIIDATYSSSAQSATFRIVKSKFLFSWIGRGESVDIPVVTPQNVARTLLRRIAGGKVNVDVSISGHDPRLAYTRLFAAESARNITGAKFYSSFNEFCDWMAAVFGYVYYLGEPVEPEFRRHRICGRYVYSVSSYQTGTAGSPVSANDIVYVVNQGRFLYRNPQTGGMYLHWLGSEDYNGSNERARTDTLFTISQLSPTNLYYFGQYNGGPLTPTLYEGTADSVGVDKQTVYFVHRSELLNPDAPVRKIPHCREVKYSVDSGAIYSSVTIGYDKKDYDSINGRDEFNFNNTYSTGSTVTDKTLQLLSKYRADCYGIEFAVQKRGKETTDSTSDKDVFFVLCKNQNGALVPDRTTAVTGTLSDQVFNADFSPLACVRANAGYIGIQSKVVNLAFASSAGNSDITIAGVAMSADITLNTPLATCGSIDFTTDAVDDIANPDEIIEITDGGMTYRGFLKEVDVKYARTEAAKYKLIIKEIEI